MNVTVAITGASGTLYAKLLLEELESSPQISNISVIMTPNAIDVAKHELGGRWSPAEYSKVTIYDNNDFFTPIASGSAVPDAMVVVPCSMGMVARIAHGISDDLISRAADVIIKERRKLILVPRETPLSAIHLRNLTTLAETNVIILPATPSFYHNPTTVEGILKSVVNRLLQLLGVEKEGVYMWQK